MLLLDIEKKSGKHDQESSEEWLVNTGLGLDDSHSEHHGQFYESSFRCMPMDYFRRQQQQTP